MATMQLLMMHGCQRKAQSRRQDTLQLKSLCASWLKGVSGAVLEAAPACDAW